MDLETLNQRILERAQKNDFSGYDPFDGLNSSLLSRCPRIKNSFFGLIWIQFHKRSRVNLRKFLGVPMKRNPKGIALFILGLMEDYRRTKKNDYLSLANALGDWLISEQCNQNEWGNSSWGYHFDWKAKAFFVPKGKPNMITTVYVAQALYKLGEVLKEDKYLKLSYEAAEFMVNHLYIKKDSFFYFAYIPGEETFVHNANLWGAAWVGFVSNKTKNKQFEIIAERAAKKSIEAQEKDGSWAYGTSSHHHFKDGFHTGYNLEALYLLKQTFNTDLYDDVIEKGLSYYRKYFFEEDGTAKYYHNNCYPLDMHSVSQAILTFIKVKRNKSDVEFIKKIIQKSIDSLLVPDQNKFIYQKYKYFNNNIDYIRWTQAWAYYSFACFNRNIDQK